jgi:plasmid stabilization system protein ParE
MKIIWGDQALEDLDTIYQNLASVNKKAAVNLYNDILDRVEILLDFPTIAPIELLNREQKYQVRSLLSKNRIYKIVYYVKGDHINIAQIWDCRRNPANFRL